MTKATAFGALLFFVLWTAVRGEEISVGRTPYASFKRHLYSAEAGERPCLSWKCKRESFKDGENIVAEENYLPEKMGREAKPENDADRSLCLSWHCRRDRIRQSAQKEYLGKERRAKIPSTMERGDDVPCISWKCKRGNPHQGEHLVKYVENGGRHGENGQVEAAKDDMRELELYRQALKYEMV